MPQTTKISRNNTKILKEGNSTIVRLHSTNVVELTPTNIILNSGGWETATTRTRMNQASNQFNLGYRVFSKKSRWFVDFKGTILPFSNGMTLIRNQEADSVGNYW